MDPETEILPPEGAIYWTPRERESWAEFFHDYTEVITAHVLEETVGLAKFDEAALKEGVRVAATLADIAMQELQYRAFRHPHQTKTRSQSARTHRRVRR